MTTTTRTWLKDLGPEELKLATATDKQLTSDLAQLERWKGRFIGYGVLAWSFQQGIISANEFDLLYWWKVKKDGRDHSDKQKKYRADLVTRMTIAVERWLQTGKVKSRVKKSKNGKEKILPVTSSKAEKAAKKKAARERFYAEMRAKRAEKCGPVISM